MKPFLRFLLLFCSLSLSWAKPQYGISTNGKPKYPENFLHFDYVNPDAPKGGMLVLGRLGTFNSFNPFIIKGDGVAGIAYLDESFVHGCLMARAEDEPDTRYGMIAESVEVAPDRSWVDFVLRAEATFSDGTPILASDVVFTFETLLQKGKPFFKMYYKDVQSVHAVHAKKVRFVIKNSHNKEIQNILGQLPILSERFYKKYDFDQDTLVPPVGSGPYVVKSFIPGREVVFERLPFWWGDKLAVMKGRFNPKTIKITYFMDEAVAFEAFKAGKYDLRMENTIQKWLKGYDFPAVKKGDIVKSVFKIPAYRGTGMLVFNTRRPHLSDIRVRQAISLTLDFGKLNRRLFGGLYKRSYSYFENTPFNGGLTPSEPVQNLLQTLNPKLPSHILKEPFRYTYPYQKMSSYDRLVLAQKLLKEAGFVITEAGLIHEKSQKPLEFTILLPRGQHNLMRIIQDYARNLERIGIQVILRTVEENQLILAAQNFDFDIMWGNSLQTLSPGNEQREFWSCKAAKKTGSRNLAGICDPTIDQAIEHLISAQSYEDLILAAQALDRLLLWGFYNLPLWHSPQTFIAHHKKIKFPEYLGRTHHFTLDTLWIDEKPTGSKA